MESALNMPQAERVRRPRHRSIVWPLILIGLGALLLAQNFGLVGYEVWRNIWQLWPAFLVLVGIDLIFGRNGWVRAIVALAIVAFVLAAISLTTNITEMRWSDGTFVAAAPMGTERVAADLDGARSATVDLRHSAGRLTVAALDGESSQLFDAELAYPEDRPVTREVERTGDRAIVRLSDQREGDFHIGMSNYRDDWTVGLSPKVALDMRINSGASELNLDLRGLMVSRLDIQAGASAVKVNLPEAAGQTNVHIQTGAAGIEVTVPEGVAARIHTAGGLSGVTIDQGRFHKVGEYYESPNYNSATNRVDLQVQSGMSGLVVR